MGKIFHIVNCIINNYLPIAARNVINLFWVKKRKVAAKLGTLDVLFVLLVNVLFLQCNFGLGRKNHIVPNVLINYLRKLGGKFKRNRKEKLLLMIVDKGLRDSSGQKMLR